MEGFDRPWWVVGGWAIESATGYRRDHGDTDVSILACGVPAFVECMRGRWHVWNNVGGVLPPHSATDGPWSTSPAVSCGFVGTPPLPGSSTCCSPLREGDLQVCTSEVLMFACSGASCLCSSMPVWVNGNWRVTFRFLESDIELVDYQDYH